MFNDIELILKELRILKDEGTLIIVEGKRDEQALRRLGFTNILSCSTHSDEIARRVKSRANACAILTDLDPAGRKLSACLRKSLEEFGVSVDTRLRRALLTSPRIQTIEALDDFFNHLTAAKVFLEQDATTSPTLSDPSTTDSAI